MALIYKPLQSNLENKDGEKTWHPVLMKTGQVITTQDMSGALSEMSTLTPGDVHGVLRNLPTVMRREMLNGNTVKIEGLGTFTFKSRSAGKGVLTAEEVNSNQITLRCQFTPEYTQKGGAATRTELTEGATFIHIDRFLKKKASTEGSGDNGNNEDDENYVDPDA